jgi:DeoR/GlpR family transcriptional regulator of sugar metabolism
MFKDDRKRIIIELLQENGSVNVKDLSTYFHVTMMTVRRDLDEIESDKLITRTHGGAIYRISSDSIHELPTLRRMPLMIEEKQQIAKKAAKLIEKDDMIFLGSGTTTLYIAKEIAMRDDISVITNSLTILNELATNGKMTLIAVGGFLRRSEYSMIGHFANNMIKELHVDKLIMGMRGIHPRFGLTSAHPQELMTDKLLINISEKVIIVADHTKIGHVAASLTEQLSAADLIITTSKASPEIIEAIQLGGVEVMIA